MFLLMLTWKQGRQLMRERLRDDAIDLHELPRRRLRQPAACACPAPRCSCPPSRALTPNALLHNLKHNKVLHEYNLFVTVQAPRGALDRLRQAHARSSRWATTAGR